MKEIWKDINGYEGRYKVSTSGKIKSLISNKVLSPGNNGNGYFFVHLWDDSGEKKREYVHRLVLETFKGNPNGKESNHKNGIKADNRLENLEWVTKQENGKHAYANKLNRVSEYQKQQTSKANRGSGHGNSVLTENDIPKIREMADNGMTHKYIAKQYNCHRETIGNIIRGNTWTHV